MNNETKQIDRPRCLACGELIGAEVECGLAFATEAEFASYRKRVWGEKLTAAAAQAQLAVATAPDLLASVRGALREAETLWSNLDNLRHEVSACEGLSETGSNDVQFKLKLAAESRAKTRWRIAIATWRASTMP